MDCHDDYFIEDGEMTAITLDNFPTKIIIQALMNWCRYRAPQKKSAGLPPTLKSIFTIFCDKKAIKFRYARVALATNVVDLFEADTVFCEEYILPLFNWHHPKIDAICMWRGFLHSIPHLNHQYENPLAEMVHFNWKILLRTSSQLYHLWRALKPAILDTANHYAQLGHFGDRFAALLTAVSLEHGDTFTPEETKELFTVMSALPRKGLQESTRTLYIGLELTEKKQREYYWKNRILPFWKKCWPQSNDMASSVDAEALALVCILAGSEFPRAIKTLMAWLDKVPVPDHIILRLKESGLPTQFPEESLRLLTIILDDDSWGFNPPELRSCLDAISQAAPNLRETSEFKNIDELARRIER